MQKTRFIKNLKILQKSHLISENKLLSQEEFLQLTNQQGLPECDENDWLNLSSDTSLRTYTNYINGRSIPDLKFLTKLSVLSRFSIDDLLFKDISINTSHNYQETFGKAELKFFKIVDDTLLKSNHPIIKFYNNLKIRLKEEIPEIYTHSTDRYLAFKSSNPLHIFSIYRKKNELLIGFNLTFRKKCEVNEWPGMIKSGIQMFGGKKYGCRLPIGNSEVTDEDYSDEKLESIIELAFLTYSNKEKDSNKRFLAKPDCASPIVLE